MEVVLIYLGVGVLLALLMSRREATSGWDAWAWGYVLLMWPHYVCLALPAICRMGLARLASAEVWILGKLIALAVRRLDRRGLGVTLEKSHAEE